MFKFEFGKETSASCLPANFFPGVCRPAIELPLHQRKEFEGEVEEIQISGECTLKKGLITASKTAEILSRADLTSSDLIPGIYEGGFKLWEGAIDLCQFLLAEFQNKPACLKDCRVLELGCGHGLPGILCLKHGACVHFQDFNPEVLTELTMFNVGFAIQEEPDSFQNKQTRFFAGEFQSVGELCQKQGLQYDRIIASEILYQPESYPSILEVLSQCLKPGGRALIASKCCYFGVGGDLTTFTTYLESDGRFRLKQLWESVDGSHSQRAIIEIFCMS